GTFLVMRSCHTKRPWLTVSAGAPDTATFAAKAAPNTTAAPIDTAANNLVMACRENVARAAVQAAIRSEHAPFRAKWRPCIRPTVGTSGYQWGPECETTGMA